MKKYLAFLFFALVGSLSYAQTTVTLEDQCDCQVLSGTAVNTAGQSSPAGSDAGDIYVNTTTGVIFYWDGDSWELTSTDDQQLQRFEYNNATSILTLEIEDGNTLTVDLSALNSSGTDDQNASEVPFDNTASGLAATDVQQALDALDAQLDSDLDQDPNNELNTGIGINAGAIQITDNGGTLSQNLISLDANNSILAGTDGGLYLNFSALQALSTLTNNGDGTFTYTDESGTATTIDIRANNINYDGTTSGLTSTDVQGAIDEVAASVAADGDTDSTNELNTTFAVNGANLEIADNGGTLQVPLTSITAGVNTDNQNLTGATLDGSNVLQIDIEDGTSTTVDLSSLEESADVAANTTAINTNTTNIATNATDISNNTTAINTNTTNIATNATDISNNTTAINTNTTNIAANNTAITNHVAADGDLSDTNELNTTFAVNGANLEITDAGGTLQVPLASINSGVNTDEQDLTGASLDGSSLLQIDIENGASTTVSLAALEESADIAANTTAINTNTTNIATNATDISNNTTAINTNTTNIATNTTDIATNATNIATNATDIATNATDIATNTTDIATNATDIANHIAADADTNVGNEYNTGSAISAGSVQITDGGGTESVNLISADANNDIAVGSDGALYLNVASVTISETITNLVDNGNGTITYTNENGVNQTVNKASLTDNLDGTYTFNNGSGAVNITGTDEQDLTGASLDGSSVLQIDIENGASTTVNLSALEESADIAANTTAINTNTTNIATNATDISTNATNITANNTAITNHVAADGDLSSTNELNTTFAVNGANLEITDAGGTLQVPLASINSGVNTDEQDLTGASLDGSSLLQIDIENGASTTVSLSALEESADIAANTTAINTNTTNIATNATDISTNATNITANNTAITNHVAADGDLNSTNELNTTFAVNGANLEITDAGGTLQVPLASINSGVNTDEQDLTGASLDGSSVLQIDIENGASTTVNLSALEESADIAANTTAINNNTTNIATNATDISTNATNITANNTAITNHVAADGDLSSTNELNTTFAVNGANLEITDAGGTLQVPLASINSGVNTDEQDLTGASLNGSSVLQIDIENGASTTVNLSALEESADIAANTTAINTNTTNIATNTTDIATNATNIGNNTTNITTNATDIATNATDITTNATDIANHIAADADTNVGNEYNTGSAISAGSVQITDGGGTESINLISGDANNDIAFGSDGALYLNVASVTISETITNLSDNGNGTFTYVNENGVNQTVNKASLTDNLDGTYTFNNGSGAVNITGTDEQDLTGASLDGSSLLQIDIENGASTTVSLAALEESADIAANTTAINTNTTNIATNATDISNNTTAINTNTTDIATNATNITANNTAITNHVAADGDLSSTNELNTTFAVNGANLEITDAGGTLQVPLTSINSGVNTDEQDLTGASLNGSSVLQIDIENGASTTVNLSALEESADIAANTTAINTNTTNIATNATDISNNTTAINTNTTDIATNATNIATNATDIANNTTAINTNTTDIATNATNITANNTAITNHVAADGDLSSTNELNTTFAVNGANLEITDAGGTLQVPLASINSGVNTDEQDLTGASLDGSSVLQIDIENGASTTVNLSALEESADIAANTTAINANTTNIATNATDISNNTSAINTNTTNIATNATDIANNTTAINTNTTNIATNATDISTNATNITANNTAITNHVAADGDLSATNELNTTFAVNGANLEITDAGGTLQVPLASINSGVNTDEQDLTGASLDGSSVLQIDIENGASTTVNLSALEESADIAANTTAINTNTTNIATNATDISTNATNITANNTAITNHVAADGDLSATNELNTTFAVNGANLEITDAGGTLQVPLNSITSGVDTDEQDLTGASLDGSSVLQIDIENGASTTVNLSALEESADIAANTTAINTNTTNIATNATNITANNTAITNHVAADGDLSATNELNTTFAVNGANLEITDAGGTLQVPLTSITSGVDTDEQDLTGASLNGSSVLQIDIENGASTTVSLAALEESADIAANTTAINTNTTNIATNATDISTNATNITANNTAITNHVAADGDLSATNELNTTFAVNGANLEITDAGGTLQVPLTSITSGVDTDEQDLTGASLNGSNVLQVDIENGSSTTVDLSALDDDITISNTISGNRIATIAQDGGSTTDIDETVTSLSQNTTSGVITYTDEAGGSDTANVVSTNSNNQISVGTDGGAYLNMPTVYAAGKINGDGTAASVYGATVTRLDEGDYEVTFGTALANSNYIIQVSTLDCGGDCPGNGGTDYDDPGITYYSQSSTGFRVNIGDSDNGGNAKDDIDLEFMFTVIVLPN